MTLCTLQFDQSVTKDLLHTVVTDIERAGGRVAATVSDMGSKNRGLWRELGIRFDMLDSAGVPHPTDSLRCAKFDFLH